MTKHARRSVTQGHEKAVAKTYAEIHELIKKHCNLPLIKAIKVIADANYFSWRGYIAKGKGQGVVSQKAVTALAKFSGLPEDVFKGKAVLTDDAKKKLIEKIKGLNAEKGETRHEKPGAKKMVAKAGPALGYKGAPKAAPAHKAAPEAMPGTAPKDVSARLREFADEIEKVVEPKALDGLIVMLGKLATFTSKRKEMIEAKKGL